MDDFETAVVFRKFPKSEGGDIIALFPEEPAAYSGSDFTSYMHVGQHGGASPNIVYRTKLATPDEYAALKAELEAEPYGYRFRVFKRISAKHRQALKAEQVRLRKRSD